MTFWQPRRLPKEVTTIAKKGKVQVQKEKRANASRGPRQGLHRHNRPQHPQYLELQRYFDCYEELNSASAKRIWQQCNVRLATLLGTLAGRDRLPKTILHSLEPTDNTMLASLAGSFQKGGAAGWVQQGSAWWFNDTRAGMEAQLTTLS